MNSIDFTKPGGFPFTQDTLDFMQREYVRMLNGIGAAWAATQGAQYVIVSGCIDSGGVISAGICAVNDELVYCPGGSGANVRIVETTQNAIYENGSVFPVYVTRMLLFQEGAGQMPWSEFKRVGTSVLSATLGGSPVTQTGTQLQLPAYPTTLPASGGNADTLGGILPSGFASFDNKQDSEWQLPVINSSATGTFQLIRRNNTVFINAYIVVPEGTVGADFVIATLPEKYRPLITWILPVFYFTNCVGLYVLSDGKFILHRNGTAKSSIEASTSYPII